jgi:hypothetical protein
MSARELWESAFSQETSGQTQARSARPRLSRDFPVKNFPTAVPSDTYISDPKIELPIRGADCKTPGILNKVRLWPFWPASQSTVAESNFRVSAAIFDKAPPSHLGVTFGAASATDYSFHSSS